MSEVVIYKAKNGDIQLNVSLTDETVWLSMSQMTKLFDRDKSVISKHLNNIFKINELSKNSVVAKFATTAADGKTYQVEHYNLDAIISVGYRVNSLHGVHFRKWATQVLRDHIISGYTTNKTRLAERGLHELEQSVALLQKTLINHNMVNDIGTETVQIILSFAKTWQLLLAYDEDKLTLPEKGKPPYSALPYIRAIEAITALKTDLSARNEATALFGAEREKGLESILANIEQTFGGEPLYRHTEERAANLLYLIIKNHPFTDGNKRIACLMFLLYLKTQFVEIKLNENGLVALALLIAESDPKQKDLMIRLVVNLLSD